MKNPDYFFFSYTKDFSVYFQKVDLLFYNLIKLSKSEFHFQSIAPTSR